MKTILSKILKKAFPDAEITIEDLSALHVKHPEAKIRGGGHYEVIIVSDIFTGKTLLIRHRLVYEALQNQLTQNIHALKIKAQTFKEARR